MKVVVEKDEGGPNEMMMMIWSTRATEAAISYCAIAAIERLRVNSMDWTFYFARRSDPSISADGRTPPAQSTIRCWRGFNWRALRSAAVHKPLQILSHSLGMHVCKHIFLTAGGSDKERAEAA